MIDMKRNGYTIFQMLFVVIVLGVATMVILGSTSYAYQDSSSKYYDETVSLILNQAELYGESLESLKTNGSLIITLNDMIDAGYYVADDGDGNVVDPRNSKATLNGMRIRLNYQDDKVEAKIMEEE